ncbi:hypothetical protein FRC0103_02268 [Corynebacterium diphtheriae]|nr:hypothetical protein FRC0103_02268 [Corynebacterium diphtheriae]
MAVITSRRSSYCPNFATAPFRVGGLFGGLDLALGDPLVVGHRHPVDGEINHVDRLLGGVIDGGLSTLHAGHVLGIQATLAPSGRGA